MVQLCLPQYSNFALNNNKPKMSHLSLGHTCHFVDYRVTLSNTAMRSQYKKPNVGKPLPKAQNRIFSPQQTPKTH